MTDEQINLENKLNELWSVGRKTESAVREHGVATPEYTEAGKQGIELMREIQSMFAARHTKETLQFGSDALTPEWAQAQAATEPEHGTDPVTLCDCEIIVKPRE